MRGATVKFFAYRVRMKFQSTLLMRGATLPAKTTLSRARRISIHAPHARSDIHGKYAAGLKDDFNPRSSCEERLDRDNQAATYAKFQSTLLMRGATRSTSMQWSSSHFNPRSSCEERRNGRKVDGRQIKFQSTLLMRGATVSLSSIDLLDFIIHFSRTQHLFPKTLLLALCPISPIFCVMALRA